MSHMTMTHGSAATDGVCLRLSAEFFILIADTDFSTLI